MNRRALVITLVMAAVLGMMFASFNAGKSFALYRISTALKQGRTVKFADIAVQPTAVIPPDPAGPDTVCTFCHKGGT